MQKPTQGKAAYGPQMKELVPTSQGCKPRLNQGCCTDTSDISFSLSISRGLGSQPYQGKTLGNFGICAMTNLRAVFMKKILFVLSNMFAGLPTQPLFSMLNGQRTHSQFKAKIPLDQKYMFSCYRQSLQL